MRRATRGTIAALAATPPTSAGSSCLSRDGKRMRDCGRELAACAVDNPLVGIDSYAIYFQADNPPPGMDGPGMQLCCRASFRFNRQG
jgi:hypothetical protein